MGFIGLIGLIGLIGSGKIEFQRSCVAPMASGSWFKIQSSACRDGLSGEVFTKTEALAKVVSEDGLSVLTAVLSPQHSACRAVALAKGAPQHSVLYLES